MEERTGTSGGVLSPGEDVHGSPAVNEAPPEPPMGFLDIIYGVFFDPRATFRRLAASPPLGLAVLIFTLVNLAGALMGALVGYRLTLPPGHPYMGMHWLAPAAPLVAVAGLVFQYVKWVVVSALLHLTAGLLGGRGRASGILTITALAALPALTMIPVDLLLFLLDTRGISLTVVTAILGLAVFIWGVVLVVLGLMEVYQFSASRALLTVLLPPAVIILSGIILLVLFAAGISSLFPLNN
ncbi:Yip1 family protein [Desulfofundulus thermosubterraneus]|uniref:Yip1 domain-containing protein n=1 Tax=Desulfofundulus thermosubterraneus DSM 16057 TaxID=1121432 RepID=A0A1M6KBV9_9FIRM|nr:Yip1 family protein [Desulfofundulus thermosubterraneus]SHJ56476.1 Yip1 domain-containing protein [Desulfofundulus thermosubterraneus DSM 16057]